MCYYENRTNYQTGKSRSVLFIGIYRYCEERLSKNHYLSTLQSDLKKHKKGEKISIEALSLFRMNSE